jgi:hypothetical protein
MAILSVLSLSLWGCSGSDRPVLGEVTGTVTLDGGPLSGVDVVFSPDKGRPARGRTDENGKYTLTYIGKTLGSKVGHNRVEIAPNEEEGENTYENSIGVPDGEKGDVVQVSPEPRIGTVPARYNTNSELKADVKPGQNVFDFKLESKPPA